MSYPEGHALKRSFAILAVLGLVAVNLVGLAGAAGGGAAPIFTHAENQLVFVSENDETQPLEFNVAAADPDGDAVTILVLQLPAGATANTTVPDDITVSWTPDYFQSGDWDACFRASDGTLFTDTCVVIRVSDVEQTPVFVPVGNKTVQETKLLRFFVAASDPDGDALSYSVENAPAGSSFNADTRLFQWTPGLCTPRLVNLTFVANDGTHQGREKIFISVPDANQPPVAGTPREATEIVQNRTGSNQAVASDPDTSCDDKLTYRIIDVPRNETGVAIVPTPNLAASRPVYFIDRDTGTITWNTTLATPVGDWDFTVRVTDKAGRFVDTTVAFRILDNELPELNVVAPQVADVYTEVTFDGTGITDAEGPITAIEWDFYGANNSIPGNTFDVDRTGPIATWTFTSIGPHDVRVRARDVDGQWNMTTITIVIDDVVNLSLDMVRDSVNIISANAATVTLQSWNGTALGGQLIAIEVVHDESGEIVSEFVAETDADGTVTIVIPRDEEELINRLGRHTVTARVLVPTSYLGDAEVDEQTASYNVTLL